jgi:hypothetical protein
LALLNGVASDRHDAFASMLRYGIEPQTIEMHVDHIRVQLLEKYWRVINDAEDQGTPEKLRIKNFIVVLAFEDMCYRLHAYRDKVFQFLNIALFLRYDEGCPRLRFKAIAELKQHIVFNCVKGSVLVTRDMVQTVLHA